MLFRSCFDSHAHIHYLKDCIYQSEKVIALPALLQCIFDCRRAKVTFEH